MKTILISDIHIGDARLHNEQPIINMLGQEKYDRLILNGDIIDCWILGHRKAVERSKLARTIVKIAKKKKVIWVAGNHDPVTADQTLLSGIKVYNMYRFDKRFLAMHGHQVYPFYDRVWYSKIAANINSFLYRYFKLDLQSFIRLNSFYKERTMSKRQEILDNFGNPKDIILMGHTHLSGYQTKDGKAIYDGGSTMLDGTYIYITSDGEVSIKKINME